MILETVDGAFGPTRFSYAASAHADGYNAWKTRTVETLPSGDTQTVYANYAGQTMLRVLASGSDRWCEFFEYNASGQVALHASPSAITGFDEQCPDLLHRVAGSYEYLRDDDGPLRLYEYHAGSGYLTAEKIRRGQDGATLKLHEYEYASRPARHGERHVLE